MKTTEGSGETSTFQYYCCHKPKTNQTTWLKFAYCPEFVGDNGAHLLLPG